MSETRYRFTVLPQLPAALGVLRRPVARLAEHALGLDGLNAVYDRIPPGLDPQSFARATLDVVGVDVAVEGGSLEHLPATGACLVVANHPHGGLDGLAMLEVLLRRRPDVRIMANHLLQRFIELRDVFIGVDPFGGPQAARFNIRAVRQALTWLRRGGLLMMFPGGEVSSVIPSRRTIADPTWDSGVGWLAEKSGAPVVPIFIDGRNSVLFQFAGLLHPRLRTALLVREMLNHAGTVIEARCGHPIDAETLAALGGRSKIAPFLETATYLIKARRRYRRPWRLKRSGDGREGNEPIAEAVVPALMSAEVAGLPPEQLLVAGGNLDAWYARADQIPSLLQEIGRLRELSFRQVGEGTGKAVDIDQYDSTYLHLFVWDRVNAAVVGGYRLGEADRILAREGSKGLYVRSLFRIERPLATELGAALEVGRSFVRPEHQRNFFSLLLLWKGIGAFVARHPRYRVLIGPVSISNDYHPLSQQIIVRFLQETSMEAERASQVKPRNPFRSRSAATRLIDLDVSDLRIIAALLCQVEDDDVGIPVLLRQYLKLNGRILGFNVDPEFNNAIDCLLWLDLATTDSTLLQKYMGREGAQQFLAHHGFAIADGDDPG